MEFPFHEFDQKWQHYWAANKTFAAKDPGDFSGPKYYVLDMFPYPSGAGLHVGHPLGYIASDIVARYKRHCGYNVLHPMGYDSFGLPAEQYAIQTGRHPADTTAENIARYRQQLDRLGFSFDWDREVRTSDPAYYRWTQWIFIQLFESYYDVKEDRARPVSALINALGEQGSAALNGMVQDVGSFSADDWNGYSAVARERILQQVRLAFISDAFVNWCPALGTVLANEEVKDGFSERGGHPVIRKKMKQWSLRITAYAERLLQGLDGLQWSESMKEAQRNWIGKSSGSSLRFSVKGSQEEIEVFTTRPDTLFGVSFLCLAPEHSLLDSLVPADFKEAVEAYRKQASARSERDRQAESREMTGVFTGIYVQHPFDARTIPVYTAEYVLAGYGTGAVMGVPGHDERDHAFARCMNLPVLEVVTGGSGIEEAWSAKSGVLVNSDFLNGLEVKQAIDRAINEIERKGVGKGKTLYRLRDAVFGRQRFWGEPIPVYYLEAADERVPFPVKAAHLPLALPEVDKYLPTEDGAPPLGRAQRWNYHPEQGLVKNGSGYELELSTMPGWAGSSWYYLRYMDPNNETMFASKEKTDYWKQVDLYLGGSEHATGHLLYVRFWTKFLYDLGYLSFDEPAARLVNQGMIQGTSALVYRDAETGTIVSAGLAGKRKLHTLHIDVHLVEGKEVNIEGLRAWREEFAHAEYELENGKLICLQEVEKMSKSKWNVVNPDEVVSQYGADCLRMYEMFLGPLELSKPWNTNGITGVHGFLKKFWRMFFEKERWAVTEEAPTETELKVLHKTIKKIREDMERLSFNTSVSSFMICVNELTDAGCRKRIILEPLLVLLSPFAPHVCEELWERLGHNKSISSEPYPDYKEEYLVESHFSYPLSVNGKTKGKLDLPLGIAKEEIERIALDSEEVKNLLQGKDLKKIVVVPGRIINLVV